MARPRGKGPKGGPKRGPKKATSTAKDKGKSAQELSPGPEGSDNEKTRIIQGAMEYRSETGWIPAVYHSDIRAQLAAAGPQGNYAIPRKQGKGVGDVTSFHPAYSANGGDREHRHPILFRYLRNDYPTPTYNPPTWMHQGRIVLDLNDDPVISWAELPLVLSSEYEGYEMEVVRRLNSRISFIDIRARMPRQQWKAGRWHDAYAPGTLSMRNSRFRIGACCLAWSVREGSDVIKAYLDRLLPAACHQANSTAEFRDLTSYEVLQAQNPNQGQYLNRAGERALDATTRQQRDEVKRQREDKLLAEHNELVGVAPLEAMVNVPVIRGKKPRGQKRKRGETAPQDEEENGRSPKRGPKDGKSAGAVPLGQSSGSQAGDEKENAPPEVDLEDLDANIDPQLRFLGGFEGFGLFDGRFPSLEPAGGGIAPAADDDWEVPEHPPIDIRELKDIDPTFASWADPHQGRSSKRPPGGDGDPSDDDDPDPDPIPQDLDFRFADPESVHDEASIQYALVRTRADCRARLGMPNMRLPTTPTCCYVVQWLQIQRRFADVWRLLGDVKVPTLVQLDAWTRHFDGWKW